MIKYSFATEKSKIDCLIIPLFEGEKFEKIVTDFDTKVNGLLSHACDLKDFEAKKMQSALLYTGEKNTTRILLIGLGKKNELSIRTWKQVVGSGMIIAQGKKFLRLGLFIPSDVKKIFGLEKIAQNTVVATTLASYAFDEHKTDKDARVSPIKSVLFFGVDINEKHTYQNGVKTGIVLGTTINYTRHLANTPPSIMTPSFLAKESEKVGKEFPKVKVTVLSKTEVKKIGMGCFLGVSQGSVEEPKFIILEYMAGKKKEMPTVLVGKGITFDSGGLSLKPEAYMSDMKFDMLGAATVLGVIHAVVALNLKKNIVGLLPSCENMPSGSAYRPDDILVNMEGKTVEIANTDAEGRLILSDALSYAKKYNPKEVIDFATLTGACMVALGSERSGLFSQDEKMVEKIFLAGDKVGEQFWRLPLGEEYSEAMKSEVADIRNIGGVNGIRGHGGASTAAAFLEFFTKDFKTGECAYPWVHIDLSCSFYAGKGKPWIRGGANGFGIETMIEYLS